MLQRITASYLSSYNYSIGGSNTSGNHISGGLVAAYFIVVGLIAILLIVSLWKVFIKAGRPGWAAIIPVYNGWVFFEISGKPGWWILFSLLGVIPIVGSLPIVILALIAAIQLAKRFGKSTAFGVGLIWLFGFIGVPILAFGDAKYNVSQAPNNTTPDQPTVVQ